MVITMTAPVVTKMSPISTRTGAVTESWRKEMSAFGSEARRAKTTPIGASVISGIANTMPPVAPEIHSASWVTVTVAPKKASRVIITRRRYVRSPRSFRYIRIAALMDGNRSRPSRGDGRTTISGPAPATVSRPPAPRAIPRPAKRPHRPLPARHVPVLLAVEPDNGAR